ncbi:hypothetical protein JTB14_010134 [Gonioctena quinquepunctata]|nr:hypothetical protein JTB14_010134 [Gonioctena quinquepunctata]
MVDHGTQTVEDPFEHNGYFHCRKPTIQENGIQQDPAHSARLDILRPAFTSHLPVALIPESAQRVLLPIPPSMLGQPNRTAVKDDLSLYLSVARNLCWRCSYPGHQRSACRKPRKLFCSRCGLY